MRKNVSLSLMLLAALTLAHASAKRTRAQNVWRRADAEIVRLSPTSFPELPRPIARKLVSWGCTIPQAKEISTRHNVIRGNFEKPGQDDLAVLCSRRGTSSIIVFWGASVAAFSEFARTTDESFLQVIGGRETIGFSRTIAAVDKKYILKHYYEYDGPKPPPLKHQGIEDGFLGKGSTIYFYVGRRWRRLQGAD
jgi:hypothetical protein